MHIRKLLIPLLFLTVADVSVYCQKIYFKILPGYNFSVCSQKMPEYLVHQIEMATGYGWSRYNINLNVNEFSIASGLNLQAAAGYPFNDFISVELRFSAITNSRKEFEASSLLGLHGKTEWDMKSYSLLPTLLLGQSYNKTSVHIFAWSGVGTAKLNLITSIGEDYREYEFDRQATFSWGYGLEFSYAISGNVSLLANIGINNSYYRPGKAHMVASFYAPESFSFYQKEIEYVDEITHLQLGPGGMPVYSSADIRLKETLRSNSLSGGIGIKYTLGK